MARTRGSTLDRRDGLTGRAVRLLDPDLPVLGVGMKMFHGLAGTRRVLAALRAADMEAVAGFVLPSHPLIAEAIEAMADTSIAVGAQDVHWAEPGPHTGSVSALLLAELGCDVVEVGHAERRREYQETDQQVAAKLAMARQHHLLPVLCVGEDDPTDAVAWTAAQLERRLGALAPGEPILVAYEPNWAIGAAAAADTGHIAAVTARLRAVLQERRLRHRVLYGGSVDGHSAAAILACPGVEGLFVGRAAGDPEGLATVLDAVRGHPT